MTKLLMLGSSHAACFKGAHLPPNTSLAIAANLYDNLFSNLLVSTEGTLSLTPNPLNPEWDNRIFNFSLADSSRNLSDYDYVIVNIAWDLDLPMLIHGDGDSNETWNRIQYSSDSLIKDILHSSFLKSKGTEKNAAFIQKLSAGGFHPIKVIVLLTPFSSLLVEQQEQANPRCLSGKIEWILKETARYARDQLSTTIILPSPSIMANGLFIRTEYCTPSKNSVWRSAMGGALGPQDRKHKNINYAKHMIQQIMTSI
jgi:hypothetical protein